MNNIALINPPYMIYGGIEGHGGKVPPLNLAYIASYARNNVDDLSITIIDAEALELTFNKLFEQIENFMPDIIGITCPTPVVHNVKIIVDYIRSKFPYIKIILGGAHPTALPQSTLEEINADICTIGEGELTFAEIITSLRHGTDLSKVKGICYRKDLDIITTEKRELISDLDQLPFPAKDLLPMDRYYLPPTKRVKSKYATNIISSRGCPFQCNYCMAELTWHNKIRFRSIDNVIDEIKQNMKDYGVTEFVFHDEFFTINKNRVLEFCRKLIEYNLNITWVCMGRVGSFDYDTLKIMKQAGCGKISIGFESGSQKMLDLMNKKADLNKAIESTRIARKVGMPVGGSFILGYPGEDINTIKKTIRFAKRLNCDTIAFFVAIPYPGTRLYEIAKNNGYLKKEMDWKEFAPISNLESPMELPDLSMLELMYWKKRAYLEFYLRPTYILHKLFSLRSLEDLKDLLRGLKIFRNIIN